MGEKPVPYEQVAVAVVIRRPHVDVLVGHLQVRTLRPHGVGVATARGGGCDHMGWGLPPCV